MLPWDQCEYSGDLRVIREASESAPSWCRIISFLLSIVCTYALAWLQKRSISTHPKGHIRSLLMLVGAVRRHDGVKLVSCSQETLLSSDRSML